MDVCSIDPVAQTQCSHRSQVDTLQERTKGAIERTVDLCEVRTGRVHERAPLGRRERLDIGVWQTRRGTGNARSGCDGCLGGSRGGGKRHQVVVEDCAFGGNGGGRDGGRLADGRDDGLEIVVGYGSRRLHPSKRSRQLTEF